MQSLWRDTSAHLTALRDPSVGSWRPGVHWDAVDSVMSPTLHTMVDRVDHPHKYRQLLQGMLSRLYAMPVALCPVGVRDAWQGAGFVADEIVALLQQRVPFRRLKYRLVRECTQHPSIAGIRVQCAGRVGGKSKKAQRAKVESVTWGQTSLHVFSSRIDFAARTAHTSLGSTGVKVWICYT
jgi:ribosomal protein S3